MGQQTQPAADVSSDDDAGGPPWLGEIAKWFVGAGVLLLLPRQWFPAGAALAIGVALRVVAERRERRAGASPPAC